ncbi:MAG: hypothetical protein ABL891_03165 [Burkholderiales bacterium]
MLSGMATLVGWLLGAQVSVAATHGDGGIQRWINTHAQRSSSEELTPARSSVVGDLDGDARNDLAVLYTLRPRGQRGERRYLAVFKNQRDGTRDGLRYHAHVLVGGSGAAEVNRATILNKTVEIEMLTHRAGDAACCPTRPSTRRYRLTPRGLVLVKESAKATAGKP